ncbi:MAG TPA: cytochrome P450 [Ktedonobacterales bacterium]|nr:cytochrome P450 [Ktedonobacterales bacterium]
MARTVTETTYTYPPGPTGFPVFGNLPQFQRDPLTFLEGLHRAYGPIATVHMFSEPVVFAFRPEHAYDLLVERARSVGVGERPGLRARLGVSLLTTDGAMHRRQRRLVQPAFHRKRVEGYAEIMTSQTVEMLHGWHVGDEIDFAARLRELTLRIIIKALFDLDLAEEGTRLSRIFATVVDAQPSGFGTMLPPALLGLPFMPGHAARETVHAAGADLDAFVYGLIASRRAEGVDRGDVLSMLLEARDEDGQPLGEVEIRDQAMTLIAAGHETTFTALSWTIDLLSRWPEAYARLRAEVADVLGGSVPGAADLARLPYLDAVIQESLRLRPPAWSINRTPMEPITLEGYTFPVGSSLIVSPWILHREPSIWGDAEVFRPERWLDGSTEHLPRGAYFPFGLGPRICIGMPLAEMEMRLVLATILQQVTPVVAPGFRPIPRPRVTLRLANGLRVRLESAGTARAASALPKVV